MTQIELIDKAVLSDQAAASFCRTLFNVSQVLDDLIDKDKPLSDDEIFKAFWDCLIEVPKNPFYIRNAPTLIPMMQVFLVDYRDSVILERADNLNAQQNDHGKHIAFVLRDSVGSIITHCAYLVGGYEHMEKISALVRTTIYNESLEQYMEALCQETQAQILKIPR
ncbi:hypothetical protein [Vibrio jasicida]|uniref:hypothetical protein n=1 Tax=Vibrio jasicida TaxID=766224 RepID=UPI0005EF8E09|nr:hypothetical protein [Vibrio jasicida]